MKKAARVLLYDIETSPNLAYVWGMYEQNVIAYNKEWELLSFSYKLLGDSKVEVTTRLDFNDPTDKSLTKELWTVLNSADVLVAHNGLSFDNKKANAKFVEHGLGPVAPYQNVDTRQVAKAHFKFNSNKLDDLGKLLGVGRKAKTPGFEMWLGCMKGDKESFRLMAKYNKQDVVLLEKVYKKLLPWIKNHPNVSLISGIADGCPKCGSLKLQRRGVRYTKAQIYHRFQCLGCGGWLSSATKALNSIKAKFTGL